LLLRSAEIKLLFSRFVFLKHFPCKELVKETRCLCMVEWVCVC